MSILSQIIAYSPNKIDTEVKARAMVGEPTDEQTQFGKPIYQTPEGEKVSEKSTTLFLNGNWMNVPSIQGGKVFNENELRLMIKQGKIQPTSVHKSKDEAEAAAKDRSNSMIQEPRYMYAQGQLVQPNGDGLRLGYSGEKGGKVGAKEVKDFKTNINNWTKNWIKENINNYEIRESNKFTNDLKKAWAKESKNKKYKVTGVDSAKGRVLTQNGFPAISTKKATNNFNIFGYEMPGGIKIENMGNAQRNLYSKIFYTNSLKKNPNLKKKINFYFDYMIANKSGTNATTLPKTVTDIMKKANITDVKDLLDKDVMYLLSKDSGLGDKARYEFFNNNFGKKYNTYMDKVNTAHGNYIKNVQIIKDKTGINVKGQLTKENNALKKLFNVSELPVELRYSGDHLFGVAQAAKSNDDKFIKKAVNNLVGMTREQNRILGLGEFENTRKNLVNKINNSKGSLKNQSLNELNTLMSDTYKDYFPKNKNNFYSLNKEGKINVSKDFVPLTQNERFTNYFKQINKTKEGKIAIKEQAGSLKNLLAQLGCPKSLQKASGGRIKFSAGSTCAIKGRKVLEEGLKNGFKQSDQALANGILKSGRFLKDAVSLKGLFGPAALAFTAAAEAGIVGYDMLSTGKSFREAVGESVFNSLLGDKTKIDSVEERNKRMIEEGMTPEQMGKIGAMESAFDELNTFGSQFNKLAAIQKNRDAISMSPEDTFNKGAFQLDLDRQEDEARENIQDFNRTGGPQRLQGIDYAGGFKNLAEGLARNEFAQLQSVDNPLQSRKGDEKRAARMNELMLQYPDLAPEYDFMEGGIASLNVKK